MQVRVGADGKRRGPTKAAVAKDGITGTGIGTTGASSVLSRSGKMQLNNSLSRPGLGRGHCSAFLTTVSFYHFAVW